MANDMRKPLKPGYKTLTLNFGRPQQVKRFARILQLPYHDAQKQCYLVYSENPEYLDTVSKDSMIRISHTTCRVLANSLNKEQRKIPELKNLDHDHYCYLLVVTL